MSSRASYLPQWHFIPKGFRQAVFLIVLSLGALAGYAELNASALQHKLVDRFGQARVPLLNDWLQTVSGVKKAAESAKLEQINDFINRRISFETDQTVWSQSDYWATPLETIGQGAGDCEDFSIIKFVSLRMAGVASNKLRLVYVKATLTTPAGKFQQAHMILAYYPTPTAEPLLLDNLNPRILPASKRPDLLPVFSFNNEGIFAGVAGTEKATTGGIGRLSRWEDVWQRILAEGYE